MRRAILAASLVLSGCGTVYTSPEITPSRDGGYTLNLVSMTPATIAMANATAYTPRPIPAFLQTSTPHPDAQLAVNGPVRFPPPQDPGPYRIGVSDVISMKLAAYRGGMSELVAGAPVDPITQTYTVQDDDSIAIPNVGRIAIAGKTMAEAEALIFQALVSKQLDPGFSLDIAQFNAKRVIVGGKVAAPGPLPITLRPLYLGEALQLAGGPVSATEEQYSVRLLRGHERYNLPLSAIYGDSRKPVRLLDGDMILVEQSLETGVELERRRIALQETQVRDQIGAIARDYVYLTGEAANPARMALPFARQASLADVLFEGGGINTRTGNYARIYVLRLNGASNVTAYRLNAENALNLVAARAFEMRPGDIVFVAEQPVTAWNRTLSQLFPTIIGQAVAQVN